MTRSSVPSGRHAAGFSSIAALWFLVLAVVGGAFLCASFRGTKDTPSLADEGVTAAARPVLANSESPATSHTKHIEDIKAGDRVWAYDTSTGTWAAKTVLKPLVHDYEGDLVTISVGDRTIQCTGNHPFWVVSGKGLFDRPQAKDVYPEDRASAISLENGRWIEARRLEPSDVLVMRDGQLAPIEQVQIDATSRKVYNLEVADLHTYAVTGLGIVVHNKKSNCFPAGTRILMGDGSLKPIEDVRLGDHVVAKNVLSTGPPHAAKVIGLVRDYTGCLVDITFRSPHGHVARITPTRFHPLWTQKRGWVEAKDLRPGDLLEDNNTDSVVITCVKLRSHFGPTYNFEVENDHTYYALADDNTPILVHNQSAPPILYHYTTAPPSAFKNGFDAGKMAVTDNPNLNPYEAVSKLGLRELPTHVYPIQNNGDFVPANPPTVGSSGYTYVDVNGKSVGIPHTGGANQYYNANRVPANQIGKPFKPRS